ncbi:hypothetical protein C7120_05055 [Prevotella sp. oral taxon 376]|uniref:hypothetical protein n=1 Tax=Prevotella sp. oral taxon 376 TaxID=712466 RepID=UPI000D1E49DB|nr:hypothetical protein [Prevotella sp. oral taxon 376]PTL33949.1 hypothetical protein C7120_05055 [Prevotella sp. oral taxon 376]
MEKSIFKSAVRMLLSLALTALLIAGCGSGKTEKSSASPDLSPLTLMDTAQMRPSLLRTMRQFMAQFPAHKAFILKSTGLFKDEGMTSNGVNVHNDIFLFCPAYQFAFDGGEWSLGDCYPSRYFVLGGKVVFVPSRSDGFMRQTPLKQAYGSIVGEDMGVGVSDKHYLLVVHGKDSVRVLPDLWDDDIKPIVGPVPRIKFKPSIR